MELPCYPATMAFEDIGSADACEVFTVPASVMKSPAFRAFTHGGPILISESKGHNSFTVPVAVRSNAFSHSMGGYCAHGKQSYHALSFSAPLPWSQKGISSEQLLSTFPVSSAKVSRLPTICFITIANRSGSVRRRLLKRKHCSS